MILKSTLVSCWFKTVVGSSNIIKLLFDKKALADGKPTERTEIIGGDKLSKLAELAGYERKQ